MKTQNLFLFALILLPLPLVSASAATCGGLSLSHKLTLMSAISKILIPTTAKPTPAFYVATHSWNTKEETYPALKQATNEELDILLGKNAKRKKDHYIKSQKRSSHALHVFDEESEKLICYDMQKFTHFKQ